LQGKKVLDVGCNAGYVSIAINSKFLIDSILGIDIDNNLIKRARRLLKDKLKIDASDFTNLSSLTTKSSITTFGIASVPTQQPISEASYERATFKHENILNSEDSPESYDVILCFKVTKWIHLNDGDEGVKKLFLKLHSLLKKGGKLLLQPQKWYAIFLIARCL
jgi:7SK snRNA methylphosphate capping enzyme